MVLKYDPKHCLPSAADLPDSDDTPVDNELQNIIPNMLAASLSIAWESRTDWFFGVDMGIYYAPSTPAIVPDGFLSLGVDRFVGDEGRLSYVLWEEDYVIPTLALEVVSKTYGGEYERKKDIYADLGILYYAIYRPNPRGRYKQQPPLEIYELAEGRYEQRQGNPIWLPQIGLGLGYARGSHLRYEREWLYWYDQEGRKLPTVEEKMQQAEEKMQREAAKADKLAAKLRELGIDPDSL